MSDRDYMPGTDEWYEARGLSKPVKKTIKSDSKERYPASSVPIDQEGRIDSKDRMLSEKYKLADIRFPCNTEEQAIKYHDVRNEFCLGFEKGWKAAEAIATPSQPSWVSVVKELVELERLRFTYEKWAPEMKDYETRNRLAWEAARELLKSVIDQKS